MFCPKCGKPEQKKETFCRSCGTFLPDFDKLKKKEIPPEEHLRANYVLSLMTAVVSLILAVSLYVVFLGKDSTPVLIYIVAGFLTAMCAWNIQTFWRTLLLKKHFKKNQPDSINLDENAPGKLASATNKGILMEADFENAVPADVSKRTTTKLFEKASTKTQHQKG